MKNEELIVKDGRGDSFVLFIFKSVGAYRLKNLCD